MGFRRVFRSALGLLSWFGLGQGLLSGSFSVGFGYMRFSFGCWVGSHPVLFYPLSRCCPSLCAALVLVLSSFSASCRRLHCSTRPPLFSLCTYPFRDLHPLFFVRFLRGGSLLSAKKRFPLRYGHWGLGISGFPAQLSSCNCRLHFPTALSSQEKLNAFEEAVS